MVWLGIHLGNWSCHVAYSEGHRTTVFPTYRFEVKTSISQIKCLLGRKLSDPELQLELDYVPFRVIEGPGGYPLVHGRCKGENRAFTPVEILAMLISSPKFLGRQEYYDSSPPCIGIPMYFTNQQKNDVLRAAKIAGFPGSFCLDETTAIVESLPTFNVEDSQTIAAFVDIGHASMQVCFGELKRDRSTERSINILYKGYARSLGGREFDKVLFMHFASKIRKEYNIDVFENSSTCFRLGEACERMKIDLSKNNEASFCIEKLSGSVDVKGSITRKAFESLSISILEKIEEALKKALSDSGLNVAKIKLIEAIGKGCSIPAIIDILTKIFGNKKISKTYNYEHVAIRCALQAEDSETDKLIHVLEMTGLETSKLLSSEFNSKEEKAEDSEKFLWRRAMGKEGQLLTFLNDFLEENMHRIGRSEKTKDESYWLCKANYNFHVSIKLGDDGFGILHKSSTVAIKMLKERSSQVAEQFYQERERHALQHELSEAQKLIEQLMSQRNVARKLSEAAQKVTEQLMSEKDDARKHSEEAQNLIEQLTSERNDARKLLEASQKFIEQLMSERDNARKLSEMAQKVTEQLTSERDDARNLSVAAHKVTEQITFDARKHSEVVQKLIEELMAESDDARKLSEAAQNVTEQLMSERDDAKKHLEAAQKVTKKLISERDDSRKLLEMAQKVTKQLTCERDDARKLLEAAQKLIEQLKSERDDARVPSVGYFAEYNYSEFQVATNNFHESFKLGEGGFGIVYRGILHNTIVAIKMMKEGTSQGAKEFNREVQILSKVQHPNLVKLIGACSETHALIYEYLPNGSLEDRLQCNNNTFPLSWHARVRIAFEICSALSFLHRVEPHGIVHGDLKPDNVLLDGNDTSKICDFGLCRELNYTASASIPYYWTDCPKGTVAYMDPEYLSTGKITPQFDVYSFGIILLRLATCKSPAGIRQLVEAAQKKGTLKALIDASAGPWPFKEAKKMITLGLRCSDPMRKNRPDLSTKVWKELKSMADIASASMSS